MCATAYGLRFLEHPAGELAALQCRLERGARQVRGVVRRTAARGLAAHSRGLSDRSHTARGQTLGRRLSSRSGVPCALGVGGRAGLWLTGLPSGVGRWAGRLGRPRGVKPALSGSLRACVPRYVRMWRAEAPLAWSSVLRPFLSEYRLEALRASRVVEYDPRRLRWGRPMATSQRRWRQPGSSTPSSFESRKAMSFRFSRSYKTVGNSCLALLFRNLFGILRKFWVVKVLLDTNIRT